MLKKITLFSLAYFFALQIQQSYFCNGRPALNRTSFNHELWSWYVDNTFVFFGTMGQKTSNNLKIKKISHEQMEHTASP